MFFRLNIVSLGNYIGKLKLKLPVLIEMDIIMNQVHPCFPMLEKYMTTD